MQQIELPGNYIDCKPEYLIKLIVEMFNKLQRHNDTLPVTLATTTRFHSRSPPAISIKDYLTRIHKYAIVEKSVLIMLLVYVDRMCRLFPKFTISSLTAHRFIIAAITTACKWNSDIYSTNSYFAKVGGISLQELNLIELEFCKALQWRLSCSESTIQNYYLNLAQSNQSFKLPIHSPLYIPTSTMDTYLDNNKDSLLP